MGKRIIALGWFVLLAVQLLGKDVTLYVSPSGNDSDKGSIDKPVRTLERALSLAAPYYGKNTIRFILNDGVYYLPAPLKLTPEYSGSEEHPVIFMALHPQKAVLSGGKRLQLNWQPYKDGIYKAVVTEELREIDQLYINGERKRMARYPNVIEGKHIFDVWNLEEMPEKRDALDRERVQSWKNPAGAYLHAMHISLWGDMHWKVSGKKADGSLDMMGGWQNNRPSKMHGTYRFIENVFEELDSPGEWFYDYSQRMLYYYPEQNKDLKDATVEVVVLDNLVALTGDDERTVSHINFEGITFRHAARTFMQNKEPLLRSDWTTYRGGAVYFNNAADCKMLDCDFDRVGGNAVFVDNYNARLHFKGCYVFESGANGFAFVGNPKMVRSPLFRYGEQDYEGMDRTPGTLGNDFPQNCKVEDCLITRTGRYEKQTAPIQISMSYRIMISHCSIYDVPRAGINICDGTFGGHVVEHCDIFNTVLETGDHGSFNSWGRDRYWTPDCKVTEIEVRKDTILPRLDMLEPNILRNSRWRCDYGWDIDLDDGSSYYTIYNNVLLNGGLKLREGYGRVVTNNILLNNTVQPHVWYGNSGDVVKNNIFFRSYLPAGMNMCIASDGKWGKEIDYNFFIHEKDRTAFARNDCDMHSASGNPLFVDPKSGNYQVEPGSPALKIGFKNFPMNFGVVSARLRNIAKQPVLPILIMEQQSDSGSELLNWNRVQIKNIDTLGEQSAVGLSDRNGVLIVSVAYNSPFSRTLCVNDVILEYAGKKICSVDDLKEMTARKGMQQIVVWRNQQTITLNVKL